MAFSTVLEEVAHCDYFAKTGSVPAPGSTLRVILGKRLFAVDSSGLTVGALPTSFNYLAACLADGFNYIGIVKSSVVSPVPTIQADFVAQ
jgi:hypothetical protein